MTVLWSHLDDDADALGIRFVESDWPHGLRCSECRHPFREGERFTTRLDAFSEDVPVTQVVCVSCGLG